MLKTILTLSISWALASAALAEQPAPVQSAQSLRRAVALLDYVAGDYGRAVGPGGEVLSPDEFKEQQQFVLEAAREVRDDAGPAGEDLVTRLQALHSRVAARASPAEVSMAARALRDEIVQRFKVALLPVHPPDLARGRALYAESCAACHGADGHAPPKEAHELSTQPPSFAVSAEVEELAPQRIFSATTYGVPNTAMPGYEDALDDAQRWDLAYFVLSLAHRTPADVRRGISLARAALIEGGYREIATQSDAALRARLAAAGLSGPDAEVALASLRAGPFSEEDAKGAGLAEVRRDLARALAQANAGDRDGARRTIISGYLDHLEPHEPAMRARDAQMVSEIEREFLALRSSLDGPKGGGRSKGGGDTEAIVGRLDSLLERADARGPGGALVAFLGALAIALREGVEAALLVAALLAILRKAGRSGAKRELVEGIGQLVTAALLLYASHWLLAAASAKRLVSFLSEHAVRAGSSAVVFGLAFAAIYREMFEVVLFFRGLLLEAPGQGGAVALGALCGLVALVGLVALFQKVGKRLRPRPLLLTCGVLLCVLAVLMVGNGVRALQEIGAVPLTVWTGFQLRALGMYGTREGMIAQAVVLFVLIGSALWSALRGGSGSPGGRAPVDAARA
ncbi:MAG: c-type cytochrome [Deltaproteobacteria bacterium]|nr:MAG: c-type cytochrome [Deltaproteobacteria bacterium]